MNRAIVCLLAMTTIVAACACNLLQGRVEAEVAGHHVIVTDCYRTRPPAPERLPDDNGVPVYRYAPCRDAVLMLHGAGLQVNGRDYGLLGPGDEIVVDHGQVSINRKGGVESPGPR